MQTTITSKGQVTIPKAVRDALRLHAGDRLEFILDKDGSVRLVPGTRSVTELKDLLPRPSKSLSLDEIDAVIAARVPARPGRKKRA